MYVSDLSDVAAKNDMQVCRLDSRFLKLPILINPAQSVVADTSGLCLGMGIIYLLGPY